MPDKELYLADALLRTTNANNSHKEIELDLETQICVVDLTIEFSDKKHLTKLNCLIKEIWCRSIKKVPEGILYTDQN